jgi:hypothetical protein
MRRQTCTITNDLDAKRWTRNVDSTCCAFQDVGAVLAAAIEAQESNVRLPSGVPPPKYAMYSNTTLYLKSSLYPDFRDDKLRG